MNRNQDLLVRRFQPAPGHRQTLAQFLLTASTDSRFCRSRKKGRQGRRRRLKGERGRGTLDKEKPPILGLIQRDGQVLLRMLPNVKQKTIKPIITTVVVKGTMIYTDEYSIYARLSVWGYQHNATAEANMRATRTAMVSTRSIR